jgi:peptide/nickel transport system permease protein
MKQYVIRRALTSVLVLFGVTFLIYVLLRMMPGDFVSQMTSGNPAITSEQKERLREAYGLDKGILAGYVSWAADAARGDFGDSFIYKKPVFEVIEDRMWTSFALAATAFVIQLLVAIPLGVIAATKQYSKIDYGIVFFALAGISLPSFFFAAILQRVFSMWLGILPLSGMVSARESYQGLAKLQDIVRHFILPVSVFVITGIGVWLRYVRTNMLEVLSADYVRTARAKGLPENKVIFKHAFRNTLIPIVTFIGGSIPGLFSGALITEGIFSIPGLGKAALDAVNAKDLPLLMGYLTFLAFLTLVGTLLADILYAVVDPRIRYQ